MLVGGRKDHLAMMDMLHMDLIKEFEVSSFTIEAFPSTWVIPLFMSCSNSEIFFKK
jgi:hypothetical protein